MNCDLARADLELYLDGELRRSVRANLKDICAAVRNARAKCYAACNGNGRYARRDRRTDRVLSSASA